MMSSSRSVVAVSRFGLASLVVGAAMAAGCGEMPEADSSASAIAIAVPPGPVVPPTPYYPSTLDADLEAYTLTYPVSLSKRLDRDTSTAPCFLNAAEVGDGVRIGGTFAIDQTLSPSSWGVAFSTSSAARNPYLVKLSFNLGNVALISQGKVDLSIACFGLDQRLTVTIKGVKATVTMGAPSADRSTFHFESSSISFDSVTVTGESGLIDTVTASLLEDELNLHKDDLASALETALGSSLSGLTALADLYFGMETGAFGKKTIHDVDFYTAVTSGSRPYCTSYPCALYTIY